jgi:hypothetical protein
VISPQRCETILRILLLGNRADHLPDGRLPFPYRIADALPVNRSGQRNESVEFHRIELESCPMRSLLITGALFAALTAQTPMPRNIAVSRSFGNPGQVGLFIAASDGSDERPLLDSKDSDYDPYGLRMDHPSSLLQIALDRQIFFALDRMARASND